MSVVPHDVTQKIGFQNNKQEKSDNSHRKTNPTQFDVLIDRPDNCVPICLITLGQCHQFRSRIPRGSVADRFRSDVIQVSHA